ncbi:sigma-70 family RNA polymerase sigma factor [Flammeovirgaceae bacterium SG7u.111]|nr:sigma-70 family RNA polymerase sigma factor [Flammeovirgaceae bacterium SG7u.132]WPO33720.1 sigma-70 family RNA polymerase sigma factor [Flammeovirgaceae bacterium SG7u.111]
MDDENVIWGKFKEGSSDAFYSLYDLYYQPLFYYGMRISGNKDLTRDAIHDLFLELWESRTRIKNVQSIKPYLLKSLRNIIIDILNKDKKTLNVFEDAFFEKNTIETILSQEDVIIQEYDSSINVEQLNKAFNILSSRQKEIIYLRFYSNLNYKEIAEITNLKYQSVRNLVSKALLKLKESLIFFLIFLSLTINQLHS